MATADLLLKAAGQTVIITGAANGIGAETARLFLQHGANVVIADLPASRSAAEDLIATLSPDRAIFIPVDILVWSDMLTLFKKTKEIFGRIDIVIANAGIMESQHLFHIPTDPNNNDDPIEPKEHHKVIDINLKGTLNTLTLAMHHLKSQPPLPNSSSLSHRGSVLLIISTSGYFGGSGVMAYVASKHGITGLLRACQKEAQRKGVRVNAVAPYFTPTHMTGEFAQRWREEGLPANTALDVATAVAGTALDEGLEGKTILVSLARAT